MNIVKGDLIKLSIEGDFDVIIHGCNCFCSMGAGIAKTIKSEFPEAYQADLQTGKGNKEKLGTYSSATVMQGGHELTIINAYTQFNWSGRGVIVNYDAIRSVFGKVKEEYTGKRIGYPLIGAGLAGGDWGIISKVIDEELADENHTLVQYAP